MLATSITSGLKPAENTACGFSQNDTPLIVEATTSWSYVGAGLRLTMELLGPEYSMSVSTLDGGAKVFFSRRIQEQQVGFSLLHLLQSIQHMGCFQHHLQARCFLNITCQQVYCQRLIINHYTAYGCIVTHKPVRG